MTSRLGADDLHLFNEGTHYRLARKLGAHPTTSARKAGRHVRRLGPERRARCRSSATSTAGTSGARPARRRAAAPGSGRASCPAVGHGDVLQVPRRLARAAATAPTRPTRSPSYAERAAAHRLGRLGSGLRLGRRGLDGGARRSQRPRRARSRSTRCTSARGGGVPEDGNRPLTYRELAEPLPAYAAGIGFTHVELLPVMEHPFYGSWGYQTTGYFAPTSRYGTPQDFMYLIDALHRRGIGVILDWVPSHFPTDAHGLALLRRHAPLRARRSAAGLPPRLGQLHLQLRPQRGAELPALAAPCFWLDNYHVDGLRVDAVASMLYLDYSRKAGEWIPNRYGGRENLEAIDFLRALNERRLRRAIPDVQTYRRGVDRLADGVAARPTSAGSASASSGTWAGCTTRCGTSAHDPIHRRYHHDELTFRGALRLHRELRAAALARRGGARQGLAARQDAGRRLAEVRQPAAALRLPVRAAGQEAALHGRRVRRSGDEWNHESSLDWHLLDQPGPRGHPRAGSPT